MVDLVFASEEGPARPQTQRIMAHAQLQKVAGDAYLIGGLGELGASSIQQ